MSTTTTILPTSTEQAEIEAYCMTMDLALTDIRHKAAEWERLNDKVVEIISDRYERRQERLERENANTVVVRKRRISIEWENGIVEQAESVL